MAKPIKGKSHRIAGADGILESISDGVFTVDAQWRITSFNRAAELTFSPETGPV
ncbi:MAG: PAS domain-containing protein [Lentisphaerae bacterium]|nr:PAS domain-containing protein [Lentisphaerota bacterium]